MTSCELSGRLCARNYVIKCYRLLGIRSRNSLQWYFEVIASFDRSSIALKREYSDILPKLRNSLLLG